MRHDGTFSFALSATDARSFDRSGARAIVRVLNAGFLSSKLPSHSGSARPE
jgi:hypothetical protein